MATSGAERPTQRCATTGKTRYRTRRKALRRLERNKATHRRRNPTRQYPVDVYRCRHCAGWHLTSHIG